jgi:tetratricopeptide (TPR) repeat protein
LFYKARIEEIQGHPDKAIEYFNKCLGVQRDWKQIHNVCYWDLCWSHAILRDWENAAKYAKILREQCKWSPSTNMYQYACFTHTLMEETQNPQLKDEVLKAMRTVPELKIRYAGKSIPPEKFAITKANTYIAGNEELVLPTLELFYIWNIFNNCGGRRVLLDPFIEQIEKQLAKYDTSAIGSSGPFPVGYPLALFLKGVCFRCVGDSEKAIPCFQELLNSEKRIEKHSYIPPQAALELGLTYIDLGDHVQGKKWLEKVRDNYSGFLGESLVQVRVHGALTKLKRMARE